jgi:methyl-accepting chemotaxis protein
MQLKAKIGCGFGILVTTCLGLTIGTWIGTNHVDKALEQQKVLWQVKGALTEVILPTVLRTEVLYAEQRGENTKRNSMSTSNLQNLEGRFSNWNTLAANVDGMASAFDLLHGEVQQVVKLIGGSSADSGQSRTIFSEIERQIDEMGRKIDGELRVSTEQIETTQKMIKDIAVFLSIVGTLAGIGISWFLTRMITRPINLTINNVEKIATGDLRIRIPVLTKDEIGSLAQSMNTMTGQLHDMFRGMQRNSTELNVAAAELKNLSGEMMDNTHKVLGEIKNSAGSADSLSESMGLVAKVIGDSTKNINNVAVAIDEMSTMVGEISKSATQASSVTASAVGDATRMTKSVEELGVAAREIDKVTEAINEIADQTNLLALNATIEAARAGDSGKGFAVVAHEIKELAKQTTSATQEIRSRIDGVQRSTDQVVQVISSIISTIDQVNGLVGSISTAVGEQAAVSREVADNIAQASARMQEVNEQATSASEQNLLMAQELEAVRGQITILGKRCENVATASVQQKDVADRLQEYGSRFKLSE